VKEGFLMTYMGKVFTEIDRPNPALVKQFKELGVSTVYEAMRQDNLMDAAIRPVLRGHTIAGPAVTAINVPGDNLTMHLGLSYTQPGDVFVTSFLGSRTDNALWGELATLAGIGRGLEGIIADGAVRDVKAIQDRNFPVWSRSIFSRTSNIADIGSINVPAVCGGVLVHPGDIIVADDDGVVAVPISQAEEILERAKKRAERENEMRDLLLSGSTPYEIFGMGSALTNSNIEIINDKYHSKLSTFK
jgi:4-hydroxy-4-methyl-2-oxoglutarate aldolase